VVLLLEGRDDADTLARALRDRGLEVAVAPVHEAAARLAADSPDVVVAPASACGTADDPLDTARRREPPVEVVLLCAPSEFAHALACLRRGAGDLVAAPADPSALAAAVVRARARQRTARLASEVSALARSAALGRLHGGLAHEIANPVAVIASSLSAVQDALATMPKLDALGGAGQGAAEAARWWHAEGRRALDGAREALVEAEEGLDRLKHLSRDLRLIARADPAALAPVDVSGPVQGALRVGRAEVMSRAAVAVDLEPGLVALASAGALSQAVLQLVVRAAHAVGVGGRRRGHVRIRGRRELDAIVLEVEDDGGETEDPLWPALGDALPPDAPHGPDVVGLAVARELVLRQGGALAVRRPEGGGTVVELRLRLPPSAP
jgi:signal transduction histidine kinase